MFPNIIRIDALLPKLLLLHISDRAFYFVHGRVERIIIFYCSYFTSTCPDEPPRTRPKTVRIGRATRRTRHVPRRDPAARPGAVPPAARRAPARAGRAPAACPTFARPCPRRGRPPSPRVSGGSGQLTFAAAGSHGRRPGSPRRCRRTTARSRTRRATICSRPGAVLA
jgi:hypothetical protein